MRALLRTADGACRFKDIPRLEKRIITMVIRQLKLCEDFDPTTAMTQTREYLFYRMLSSNVAEYKEIVR